MWMTRRTKFSIQSCRVAHGRHNGTRDARRIQWPSIEVDSTRDRDEYDGDYRMAYDAPSEHEQSPIRNRSDIHNYEIQSNFG